MVCLCRRCRDDMQSGGSLDRLDRVRDGPGGGGWYIPGGGGSPWPIHKERQPEQRSVGLHSDLIWLKSHCLRTVVFSGYWLDCGFVVVFFAKMPFLFTNRHKLTQPFLAIVFWVNLLAFSAWHYWLPIRKSIWPVQKLSDEVLACYLSWARCKWFAYGPADDTATPSSLASLKFRGRMHDTVFGTS